MSINNDLISKLFPDDWFSRLVYAGGAVICVGLGSHIVYEVVKPSRKQKPVDDSNSNTVANGTNTSSVIDVRTKYMKLNNKGNDCFRRAQYQDAINCYTEAINLCPKSKKIDLALFYDNRAASFEKLENFENVISDCTEAMKLNIKYLKTILRRAETAEKLNVYKIALQDYVKLCVLENFENVPTIASADRILCLLTEQLSKEYLDKRGDQPVPLSISFVADTLSFYTTDPIINRIYSTGDGLVNVYDDDGYGQLMGFERAKASLISKQFHRIIPACTEEIEQADSQFLVESLLLRGTFLIFIGDFSKASKDLNQVLEELNSISYDEEFTNALKCNAYLKLAVMYQLTDNFSKCAEALTEAERINPKNPDIFCQKGQMYHAMNETKKALDAFEKAVSLKPNCPYYNIQLVMTEFKSALLREDQTTIRKSLNDLERLAERFPVCADAQATYGTLLAEALKDFVKAAVYLEKALKLSPMNATILVRRGVLHLHQNNNEAGFKLIQRALQYDPHCILALESMAQYYFKIPDVDKLVEYYERAMEVAKSKSELIRLITLRESALTQLQIAKDFSAVTD